MAQKPETVLCKSIIGAFKTRYPHGYIFKVHGNMYQKNGIPDLVGCLNGRFFGIEIKVRNPGESDDKVVNKVTALQRDNIQKIMVSGGVSGVATSISEFMELLEAITE